jgi:hypothetical protein
MIRFVNFLVLVVFFAGAAFNPAVAKPFAVHYALKGIVDLHKGTPYLHTADGRVFQLLMKADDARKLDGKAVGVNGKVGKSDDVEQVKVKKIAVLPDQNIEIPVVEHESYQRPAKIVQNLAGVVTVENIRWDIRQNEKSEKKTAIHAWETATINPEKVKSAYLLVKPFAPKFIAAHTLLAFSFEDGGVLSKTGKKSNNIVLTIEAYKKIGQSYGLIKTMKKEFDIVWILTNLKNYAELNVNYNESSDSEIMVYRLKLDAQQTKALLNETIKQTCVNRQGEYYHTIRNNCTNNLVILLNSVLSEENQVKLWRIPGIIYNHKATMPFSVLKTLKKKGLIGEPVRTISKTNFVTNL